jgi:hypothetical protein
MRTKWIAGFALVLLGAGVGVALVAYLRASSDVDGSKHRTKVARVQIARKEAGEDLPPCDSMVAGEREQEIESAPKEPRSKRACSPVGASGFAEYGTPWETIAVTDPSDLLKTGGEPARDLVRGLGLALTSRDAVTDLEECAAHVHRPPDEEDETYRAEVVLDIERLNGQVRIVGAAVEKAGFVDEQAERCFAGVFLRNDRITMRDRGDDAGAYRIRIAWPLVYR